MDVRIGLSRQSIELTKRADNVANIGVINVAVDDVRHNVGRIMSHPDLMRGEADSHKIVRFEQCRTVVTRKALTAQSLVKNWLNFAWHLSSMQKPARQ